MSKIFFAILPLQVGKAAEVLLSLRRRRVALLEGEMAVPGNEVAYIVKTKETFSG